MQHIQYFMRRRERSSASVEIDSDSRTQLLLIIRNVESLQNCRLQLAIEVSTIIQAIRWVTFYETSRFFLEDTWTRSTYRQRIRSQKSSMPRSRIPRHRMIASTSSYLSRTLVTAPIEKEVPLRRTQAGRARLFLVP